MAGFGPVETLPPGSFPYGSQPMQTAAYGPVSSMILPPTSARGIAATLPPVVMGTGMQSIVQTIPPSASMRVPGSMAMPPVFPPTSSMAGMPMPMPSMGYTSSPRTASYGAAPPMSMPAPRAVQAGTSGRSTSPLLRKPEQTKEEDFKKWHNVRHFIAYMFTLTSFTILAAPTIISLQLANDVDASFWIGRWGFIAIAVPFFLLGQHFYHLWMLSNPMRRRRYIFMVVPLVPAVFFMIIGGTYMSYARQLYGQLKSDDCSASSPTPAKFWMQEAYDEAHGAYQQCIIRLEQANMGKPLRRHPNLQSCTEWEDLLENTKGVVPWKGYKVSPNTLRQHNPSNDHRWQYLADIEMNHLCGGFCNPGPALFASYDATGRAGGSCAQFVAFRFLSIAHWGLVVFVMGLLIMLITIPAYLFSRSFLTNMGYKSGITLG